MSMTMAHMPPLVVDDGDVTVLRRMAAYTWGTYKVTWPEGFEPPELAPDRELGFVTKLPTLEGGRFSRRFVRADAQIDAANGYSNVEQILDQAESRTGGDVFFDRDITTAGLGRLVPGVHFQIGDVVPVRIWGRVMFLPVTAIDEVSEPGNVVGHRVHVGGQLISDDASRELGNRDLERVIAQERRERQRELGAVKETADSAKFTADTIDVDIDLSVSTIASELGIAAPEGKEERLAFTSFEMVSKAITADRNAITANENAIIANKSAILMNENRVKWAKWTAHKQYWVGAQPQQYDLVHLEMFPSILQPFPLPSSIHITPTPGWEGRLTMLARFGSGDMDMAHWSINGSGSKKEFHAAVSGWNYTSTVVMIEPFWGVEAREFVLMPDISKDWNASGTVPRHTFHYTEAYVTPVGPLFAWSSDLAVMFQFPVLASEDHWQGMDSTWVLHEAWEVVPAGVAIVAAGGMAIKFTEQK